MTDFLTIYTTLVLNIGELVLKGANQKMFSSKLKDHIKAVLKVFHEGSTKVQLDNKRMVIQSETPFLQETVKHLSLIPGVYRVHLGRKGPLDLEQFLQAVDEEMATYDREYLKSATFKVACKRSNKKFPMSSYDLAAHIGDYVLTKYPELKVKMKNPELTLNVKVMSSGIYLYSRSIDGIDGLPVTSTGKMVTMLSGGFDSPVASYLMAKRGVAQTFIFFHAYPFVGEEVKEKIFALSKALGKYQRYSELYVVPFGQLQQLIAEKCRPSYRTLLFRAKMIECANAIAEKVGAQAIITGDALGQVASQTLANLAVVDQASKLPIFRPLVGLNKQEIIEISRKIGTYAISVLPQDDACSLLAPKHPATKPNLHYWQRFNETHDFSKEIEECVKDAEIYQIPWKEDLYQIR